LLLAVGVVAFVVVAATGATRVSVPTPSGEVTCPGRALSTSLSGPPNDLIGLERACVQDSQQRMYAVTAAVMGLVLISGLLSRSRP